MAPTVRRWDRRPRPWSLTERAIAGLVLLIVFVIAGGIVWLLSMLAVSLTGWH